MDNTFEEKINGILQKYFDDAAEDILKVSLLLQYLVKKTKSANRGAKARGSFGNIYAIYVLVEDYIKGGFGEGKKYSKYSGAVYSKLFDRQRQLPFGKKLQNHALNNRLNAEFEGYFPTTELVPIIRSGDSEHYWFNEHLLIIEINKKKYNIAQATIEIIDEYIKAKKDSFERFIEACEELNVIEDHNLSGAVDFVISQLQPNVDARLFEIVSYSILKYHYEGITIFWGYEPIVEKLNKESLTLYKTGRTNANDGGIDFVMRPLGRFFQVTETTDYKKYFLDIDKLQRFPITFVVKSEDNIDEILAKVRLDAEKTYPVQEILEKYMACIEEVINIPRLRKLLEDIIQGNKIRNVMNEIILQSKLEFNYSEEDE